MQNDHYSRRDDLSLVEILSIATRRWRLLMTVPLAASLVVVGVMSVLPKKYTARGAFMPQTSNLPQARLSGLATQLGLALPGGENGESPQFYADLLKSQDILKTVVSSEYSVSVARRPRVATLTELYNRKGAPEAERVESAIDELQDDVSVGTSRTTDVVTLAVTTGSPELSKQIADRLLELLDGFNRNTRKSRAAAERAFVQERLNQTRQELRAAEANLTDFMDSNRVAERPRLRLEREQLLREVETKQEVITSLTQAFEQARIEEVRNTPVVTVLDRPDLPVRPDSKRLGVKSVFAALAGLVIAVYVAFAGEATRRARVANPLASAEYDAARVAMRREVARILRLGRVPR